MVIFEEEAALASFCTHCHFPEPDLRKANSQRPEGLVFSGSTHSLRMCIPYILPHGCPLLPTLKVGRRAFREDIPAPTLAEAYLYSPPVCTHTCMHTEYLQRPNHPAQIYLFLQSHCSVYTSIIKRDHASSFNEFAFHLLLFQ